LIKLEIVKIKIENLREVLKFLFTLLLSILTLEVTIVYFVLVKKVGFYFMIFVFAFFIVAIFIVLAIIKLWQYINFLLKELENE
jgi:membrane protein YdbS with pleckstrin-like domain